MTTQRKNRKDRRTSTNHLIENMLDERNKILSLLLQVSAMNQANPGQEDRDLLEELCQLLVDYIAAGHFGLYNRIAEGKERRKDIANIANKIYPKIEESTQQALEFSEKYNTETSNKTLQDLAGDLSILGELLAIRIYLEDRLIARVLA
jgi:regulator of sigma D